MSISILISLAVLLIVQAVGKYFIGNTEFLVLFGITYGAFIVTCLWRLYEFLTKLKFERRVET